MGWTTEQKQFAFYCLAKVETNCNYGGANKSDAITLGILQWYGVRAYRLLAKMKTEAADAFAKLSSRLQGFGNGSESAHNWTTVYLTNEDATSWVEAAKLDSCKKVQEETGYTDIDGYISTFNGMGGDETNVKTYIMWMSAWHQGPAYAKRCMQSVGINASLANAHSAIMSNRVLGIYKNRYNTVYNLLKDWDGKSAPPDFGQSSDTGTGNDPSQDIEDSSLKSQVAYIEVSGDSLIIHGKVTSSQKLICYNTGKGIWIPKGGTVASNPGSGSASSGNVPAASKDDPKDFPAMRQLWYDNASKWSYGQGPGRLSPTSSGYSDCSACIYWAANKATNNKYSWIGTWTGAMQKNCHTVLSGTSADLTIPLDKLRPGDIILMDYGGDGTSDHVDWYMGNGLVWGAGSSPLPKKVADDVTKYLTTRYRKVQKWWVCRFLD